MEFERRKYFTVFCIENNFFKCCNNYSYDRAIMAFSNRTASNQEIAAMIWVNSITDLTINDIAEMLVYLEYKLSKEDKNMRKYETSLYTERETTAWIEKN